MADAKSTVPHRDRPKRVLVLGSTGSIGVQALDVIDGLNELTPGSHEVVGLAAGRNARALKEQAARWPKALCAVSQASSQAESSWLIGEDAAERLVREVEADVVVAGVVGVAGLRSTLAAVALGRTVALANKESLVAAGNIVMAEARRTGAAIHPIDSEHGAAWLALRSVTAPDYAPPTTAPATIERLTITASGGAFRDKTLAEIQNATPEQALKHPNWDMGAKVTIDSATLINKGLELIEAHWLFDLGTDRLRALIHPQSAVHAIVELVDGSSLAQIAPADMRIPIRLGITAPNVAPAPKGPRLDPAEIGSFTFTQPDPERWPALRMAFDVIEQSGGAGAVMNAANEVAVNAFLNHRVKFGRITEIVRAALDTVDRGSADSIDAVLDTDRSARAFVEERLAQTAV